MTPISFMTAFMKSLIDLDADTDKFNKTIDALTPFNSAQAVIDSIHSDIASAKSANDFLLTQCGIDLSNADVGGLLGYDTSGNDVIDAEDVLDETGLPLQQTVPRTAVIEGFTITFPDMNTLTTGGKFINKALYSWWYPLAFKKIKEGYGLSIVDTSYVKQMDTDLFQEPRQNGVVTMAYVNTHFDTTTGIPDKLSCRINTHNDAYGGIDTTNPNGYAAILGTDYLDRTLLHELTHALMSANIRGFISWLPKYFLEGSAELMNGCDDTRGKDMLYAINNVSVFDEGFSQTPSSPLLWYITGVIFLRYLIKHSTSYVPKDTYKPPIFDLLEETNTNGFMFERGITRENNFEKIFTEYSEFLQKKSDAVQAWELCDNSTLHSYYGNTFRIPLKNAEEKIDSDIAEIIIERKHSFKYIAMTTSPAPYLIDGRVVLAPVFTGISDNTFVKEATRYTADVQTDSMFSPNFTINKYGDCSTAPQSGLLQFIDISKHAVDDTDSYLPTLKSPYSYYLPDLNIIRKFNILDQNDSSFSGLLSSKYESNSLSSGLNFYHKDTNQNSFCGIHKDYETNLPMVIELMQGMHFDEPSLIINNTGNGVGASLTKNEIVDLWKTLASSGRPITVIISGGFRLEKYNTITESEYHDSFSNFTYTDVDNAVINALSNYSNVKVINISSDIISKYPDKKSFDNAITTVKDFMLKAVDKAKCRTKTYNTQSLNTCRDEMLTSLDSDDLKYSRMYVFNDDFRNFYNGLISPKLSVMDTKGNLQRVPVSPFDKFNADTKVYVAGTFTLAECCHVEDATKRIDEVIKDYFGCTNVIVECISSDSNTPDGHPIYNSLSYYTSKINAELSSCISQGYEYFIFDCPVNINEPMYSYISLIDTISNTAHSSNVVPIFIGTPHGDETEARYKYGKKLVNSITSCKAVDVFTEIELVTGATEDTILSGKYDKTIIQWFCNSNFSHMGVHMMEYIFYNSIGVPIETEEFIKFKVVDKVSKKSPCYYLTLAFHITPDEYRGGKRPDCLFANKSAEFASFNLHQLYDKNLVSYEQGGGVAKRSFDMEIRNKMTHLGLLNYTKEIPHPRYMEISHEGCYTYPMDNTGCPLISYASDDHEDYDNIEFFFTKTNYGSNITLCFYSSKKESVQPIWQSISFGTFDTHEESYIMPLYIGGGTTGLRSSSYTYSYTIPGNPSHTITEEVHGKLYDFSITQYSGSMSNLLYPTKLDETNITNFFVLAPDGEWKSLYNSVQETRKFGEIDVSTNTIKDTDSHGIVYSTASDDTRDTFDYSTKNMYSLYPISMYSENEENGYMGSIPYNFGVTSRASTGLTYINGDRYLIIPNGWEHRIAYPFTIDSNSSDSVDEQLRKYMLNISKLYFKNHLAIKVGDKVGTTSVSNKSN